MKYLIEVPEDMIKWQAIEAIGICVAEQIDDLYDLLDEVVNK